MVRVVCQIDKENRDVQMKFIHPHFPACSFAWPTREDVCWVPDINVILVVDRYSSAINPK